MELRQLRYFVAVAEELSFTRAAERENIAQPPLSQQIQRFELELGVNLFLRSKRRVTLTDAGLAILDGSRRTLAEAATVENTARRVKRGEAGVLRLGFSGSAPYTAFPAILRELHARAPEVKLELLERSTEQQVEVLASGAIDAGFIRLPIENRPATLVVRTILREPLVLAMARGHRLGRNRIVAVRDLVREPLIIFPRHIAPGLYDQIIGLCRASRVAPQIAQEAAEMPTIISLVSAGLGVAIVPSSIQRLQRERVIYRPLRPGNAMTEMALAYDRGNRSAVLGIFLGVVERLAATT